MRRNTVNSLRRRSTAISKRIRRNGPKKAVKLIELMHFSGCPNSCTAHEVSCFGFQGCKKTLNGVLTDCFVLWRNPEFPASPIGTDTGEVIPAAEIGERVIELLKEEKILNG